MNWIEPQPVAIPDGLQQVIPAQGDLGALVARLMVRRGIVEPEAARRFLDPAAYIPASPGELPDLPKAVVRLEQAIVRGEGIAVWGDFDVDGQTATALYVQALRAMGGQVTFHIPTRRESHGVHLVGVQRLIDQGIRLIVTADTGVDAQAAISLAMRQGVDVLITDHHDLPEDVDLPVLVNPKRLSVAHPLYELPGVGVAYQVIRALHERMGGGTTDLFLDLVALGIVADVATLRADVRYLLQRGLEVLRRTERPGLLAMMALANIKPDLLSEEDIRFALAPRLNAAGRLGEDRDEIGAAADAVELLITLDQAQARVIATNLEGTNARRRWLTRQTLDAALSQLERDRFLLSGPAIVVASPNWDPGIVGIVAGQLAAQFARPAVVIGAPPGELARGSARSVEGIDIHAAIAAQRQMLHRCGGHPMAAGLSLESERVDEFRRALWRTLERTGALAREPEIEIDAYLSLDQASLDLTHALEPMSPFGPGNGAPIFATRDLQVVSSAVIGRTREHRRLVVRDVQGREETVFWWRSADELLPEGRFDLAYTVSTGTFRGVAEVQPSWVAARSVEPVVIRVPERAAIEVIDYRDQSTPLPTLRALLEQPILPVVWSEGAQVPAVGVCDRRSLRQAETLIVWTAPPDPIVLRDALQVVAPKQVVLFGVDPGLDAMPAFARRLAGLVKHVLRARGGQVEVAELAAAMAHSEHTVRLGLSWMAEKGQIQVAFDPRGWVAIWGKRGNAGDRLHVIEGQLKAQLLETAAYRGYFRKANAERLINER